MALRQERLLRNDRKFSADAAVWRVKSRQDSWQVMFPSALEACAALQTSLMDRNWNIFCATSGGNHGKRARDILMLVWVRIVRLSYFGILWET
ncbi:g5713 [Coccomyxa elongata]